MGRPNNRLDLRRQYDAAEKLEQEQVADGVKAPAAKKKAAPRKAKAPGTATATKAKVKRKRAAAKEVRLKAFWGVFNQSMKPIAKFEYTQRGLADARAAELSTSQKSPHFVQIVKEEIKDE